MDHMAQKMDEQIEGGISQNDALLSALMDLLDAMACQGAATWETALPQACLMAGRYCEPYLSTPQPFNSVDEWKQALADKVSVTEAFCRVAGEERDAAQARAKELEAEQVTTHAILQELSDTDRLCLCGKCLPCRAYTVLNPKN